MNVVDEETQKENTKFHHKIHHQTFKQFCIEMMTLKLAASVEACGPLWHKKLAENPALVMEAPNGELLLGEYDGADQLSGWEQELAASRRQKIALTGDEEMTAFKESSDSMLSAFADSLQVCFVTRFPL